MRPRLPHTPIALAAALAAALLGASPAHAVTTCQTPAGCDGGPCVDGFCCDKACSNPCESCSAAGKGGGVDGVCGQAKAGRVCKPYECAAPDLSYIGPSICDVAGNCVSPPPVSCLHDNPCKLDLCGHQGCEIVIKNDGAPCDGGVCVDGTCGPSSSTSSSSSSASSASSSSSGAGGAGGAGGTSSTGSGAGGQGAAGGGDPYPPLHPTCGCRAVGEAPAGGAIAAAIAALALLRRRRG